jgi:antitoxin component YwqK of YwqJK toxin-antitoxin module
MKHLLSILILVGFQTQSQAQISYTPVFIEACTHEIVRPESWMLLNEMGTLTSKENSKQSIVLPRAGEYKLIMGGLYVEVPVQIGTQPVQSDTLLLPRLMVGYLLSDPPISVYTDCGNVLAEGTITDYYLDSTIRMMGSFKKGRAIDTVWTYYPSGKVQRIEFNTAEEYHFATKTYFESGSIETASDKSQKVDKVFYPTGGLKSIESNKGKISRKEYYENGTLKLDEGLQKRMQFDSLEHTTNFVTRHKVPFTSFGIFPGSYKTKWIAYDANENKTRRIDQKSLGYSAINKSIKEIHHSEFEKATFWKNGKKHLEIYRLYDDNGMHFIVSKNIGGKWKEVSRFKKDDLHNTIEAITNGKEY